MIHISFSDMQDDYTYTCDQTPFMQTLSRKMESSWKQQCASTHSYSDHLYLTAGWKKEYDTGYVAQRFKLGSMTEGAVAGASERVKANVVTVICIEAI